VPEGRLELGMKPEMDLEAISPNANSGLSTGAPKGAEPKNNRKGSDNIIRPANQYGTKTSPDIRRSENFDLINEIASLIDDMIEE